MLQLVTELPTMHSLWSLDCAVLEFIDGSWYDSTNNRAITADHTKCKGITLKNNNNNSP
jgi:hypothetical protein